MPASASLIEWIREQHVPGAPCLGGRLQPGHPPSGTTLASSSSPNTTTRNATSPAASAAIAGTDRADQRIAVYHGPTPPAEREEIKRAFNTDPKKHPLRILDCHRCRPRGPQPPDPLLESLPLRRAVESQPDGAAQRPHRPQAPAERRGLLPLLRLPAAAEDRILQALVRKTETIKRELGSLSQVLEGRLRPR